MKALQSIRGMHDVLPAESSAWQHLESVVSDLFVSYGYQEMRTPMVEQAEVFTRAMGQSTDVVEKEMYAFTDRNGDLLCLRPEGTAGVVRAVIEHGLLNPPGLKLWYRGPMFRHERPQKGRQRQFHQVGAEVFGLADAAVEVELMALVTQLWQRLGLAEAMTLELNTLGDANDRAQYRERLVAYLHPHRDDLDEDSQRRLLSNPLRIFDSKHPATQAIMAEAPRLQDHLSAAAAQHFAEVCALLDHLGIAYRLNPGLVRGLDYYSRTVFEWTTTELGAQATVCAGGRYDGLVELQGGKPTPGVGFAMGMERVLMMLGSRTLAPAQRAAVYVLTQAGVGPALALADRLRPALPTVPFLVDLAGGGLKNQFKRADRSGAKLAILLGEQEWQNREVILKSLRDEREQQVVGLAALPSTLEQWLEEIS